MASIAKLANVKKLIVFIVSEVLSAVNEGIVPTRFVHYVQLTVFFLTAIGLYAVRNTPSAPAATGAHAAPDLTAPDPVDVALSALDAAASSLPADLPPVAAAALPPVPAPAAAAG